MVELYRELASRIVARNNCVKSSTLEWKGKHEEVISQLIDKLPHGSGLDSDWRINYEKSQPDRIQLYTSYHAMDENGFYDGWIDFTLTITPSLLSGFHLNISGVFGKYQDIKEYLYDILNYALNQRIDMELIKY